MQIICWGFLDLAVSRLSGRPASDPDAVVTAFLQSTYQAAANLAHWDGALEVRP